MQRKCIFLYLLFFVFTFKKKKNTDYPIHEQVPVDVEKLMTILQISRYNPSFRNPMNNGNGSIEIIVNGCLSFIIIKDNKADHFISSNISTLFDAKDISTKINKSIQMARKREDTQLKTDEEKKNNKL